ncbi:helicase-exonuclease AddAB subunit AddA [Paenibacillus woosongensis]|uniref:ATP-dependent helicase/nuclease subunit A n=1 Tax=Paenibacillus woosongensis TaxID=307580 RepID=A0AA95L052_9BACL|nr:helicase-exonuclease AddAB subunit AddA [Paenibacillus woosongensis]WHX47724.1 helicase-exonuclease AddAB subunit AddA [Paenibacillus woosongensis]
MSIPKPPGSYWSDDQWKAISLSGSNMLIAAAAGSGKTAVLVERIIRKLCSTDQPLSVDRLLVATFTKAAATEMRQRIREALEKELSRNPANEHLGRQLAMLGRASITTLHSFCMEVIQRYYTLIPLDPGFRIASESETALLRQEVLEELFEEKYALEREGSPFLRLVDWFGGERSDDAVFFLVQKLYDFSRSHPWPDFWLRQAAEAFAAPSVEALEKSLWVSSILSDAKLTLEGAGELLRQAEAIALSPGGPQPYAATLEEDIAMVELMLAYVHEGQWSLLHGKFDAIAFGKLKPCKKDQTDPTLQERVKTLREEAKKTLIELRTQLFGRSPEAFLDEMNQMAPLMAELSSFVMEFAERYRKEKTAKGWLDFSDLEHYCLQILRHPDSTWDKVVPSAAALEYQQQFEEVLLDEYQDTNTVQEDIVRLISRQEPGNRFMVGDVKQSIYRFRLAEPGLFLQKYRSYGGDASAEGLRIDLARNFRSRREVIDAVNYVFRQVMNETVAEIAYDSRSELVYGEGYPDNDGEDYRPELLLIDRSGDAAAEGETPAAEGESDGARIDEELADLEAVRLEARAIAAKIREMRQKPLRIYDKHLKGLRPVEYRDMVILLRSTLTWAPAMMEELRMEGIPAYGEVSQGYFDASEVETMMSLLQVIDNPMQDIPLAAVLRSPLCNLSEEELAEIRLAAPKGNFYEAVQAYIGPEETDMAGVVATAEISAEAGAEAASWASAEASTAAMAEAAEETMAEIRNSGLLAPEVLADEPKGPLAAASSAEKGGEAGTAPGELWTAEHSAAQAGVKHATLRDRLIVYTGQLEAWRNKAREGELGDLIRDIYRQTGFLDWVGGLPGGAQRQGNLRALLDRARQFEKSSAARGLFRFLRYITRLRENGGDLGAAASAGEQEDAVRIMTIHKSKGLEFPVVFVAGLSKMFNRQDLNTPFLMHKEMGYGPKFVDENTRVSYPTLPNLAIRRRAQLELLAEEIRVLYVALTRPKDKLILISSVKDLAKSVESWGGILANGTEQLPDYLIARGRSYLDWIGPSLIRHPAAAQLRDFAGLPEPAADYGQGSGPDWVIGFIAAEQFVTAFAQAAAAKAWAPEEKAMLQALIAGGPVPVRPSEDTRFEDAVKARLDWHYPYEMAGRISAKTSVTEMKTLLAMQEEPPMDWLAVEEARMERRNVLEEKAEYKLHLRRPKFMEEKRMTPTERGTAYHMLMQHLPFDQKADEETVRRTLQQLVELQIMSREQSAEMDTARVAGFLQSPLGALLRQADWIRREMPFSYGLSVEEAYPRFASATAGVADEAEADGKRLAIKELAGETVLIQGIIDCLFAVGDKLYLLDYKSDRVLEHQGGVPALAETYRFQLELYAKAIEQIMGRKVDEKWLYFFDHGEAVKLQESSQ